MSGNAGNSKTGSLLQRNTFRQRNNLLQRNYRILGGGSKRTVRLSAIAPYSPSDPVPRYIFSNRVNGTRPVAVRYDPRVRHTDAKRILAFLHITRIYTGKSDTNPHLARAGVRVLHVTKGQNIPRSTLPFIPSRFHGFEYLRVFGTSSLLIVPPHVNQNCPYVTRQPDIHAGKPVYPARLQFLNRVIGDLVEDGLEQREFVVGSDGFLGLSHDRGLIHVVMNSLYRVVNIVSKL